MSRRTARALLATVLAISFAALPAAAATRRWAAAGDISTMDPHANNEGFTNFYHDHIYEPLVTRGKDLKVEPSLALSWQADSEQKRGHRECSVHVSCRARGDRVRAW